MSSLPVCFDKKFIVLLFLVILNCGAVAFVYFKTPRIAYVYNNRILTEYKGVKEGRGVYQKKVSEWQSNLDTLSKAYTSEASAFEYSKGKLSSQERSRVEQILLRKKQELVSYKSAIEEKASAEEREMIEGLLSQINSFVAEYGEQSGYDYVFGVTENGNLMYAVKGNDVTDKVIEALNKKYEGN